MKTNISQLGTHKSKGITLVALVVTITVLLILAGVTITSLLGDSGIIKKTMEAKQKTEAGVRKEKEEIATLVDEFSSIYNGGDDTTTLEKGKLVPDDAKYKLYEGVPIPSGYCVVMDVTKPDGAKDENKVSTGLVISDVEGDDLNNTQGGNQFVWVPVSAEKLTRMYDSTSKRGNLYDFGTSSSPKVPPQLITYSTTGFHEPDAVDDYDDIPSNYTDVEIKDKEGVEITTATQFEALLKKEFEDMIKSVERYDGFYIGRYETGNLEENTTSTPVVEKGNSKIDTVNWYYMYANSKKIGKNSKVTSSMIWGCQWDRTLEWIAETNLKNGQSDYSLLTESTSWGNYEGNKQLTGEIETSQKNHIYDLAGNVLDMTLEVENTTARVGRRR